MFQPSEVSGRALRSSLNTQFATSFEHIFKASEPHLDLPIAPVSHLLSRLRSASRENPFLYSLHFSLINAIEDDRLEDVAGLIAEISRLPQAATGLLITDLRPSVFPWDAEAVTTHFNAENASHCRYVAPLEDQLTSRRRQVVAALDLLSFAAPELRLEFNELITTIIFGRVEQVNPEKPPCNIANASTLRAFGGIMLSIDIEPTIVDCAVTLIHEQAHNVLFALSPMEGVVENPSEERFSSPLRSDERPMEGVYHATFVLARMVYGLVQLRDSGHLTPEDDKIAGRIQKETIALFFDGYGTVNEYGRLTLQGVSAMEAAASYMTQFT